MSGMTKRLAGALLLPLLTLAHWSNPSPAPAQGIYANYIPFFPTGGNNTATSTDEAPLTTRWLGGDAAIETRLDSTHSLWFFSDSLISNNRGQGRYNGVYPEPGSSMNYSTAHNTMAIATHSKKGNRYEFTPVYYCRGTPGAYTAFLADDRPVDPRSGRTSWLWPRSALTCGPFILVFASRMIQEPGGAIRTNNTVVIRIDTRPGPTDPSRWTFCSLDIHRYPDDDAAEIAFGASAFLMKDPFTATDYVCTFGSYPRSNALTGVRIPLDSLLGAPAAFDVSLPHKGNIGAQYLKGDSTWKAGLYGSDAHSVKGIPADFFFTTRYVTDSGAGHWRAVLFQIKSFYAYSPSRTFTYPAPPEAGPVPSPAPPADCQSAYVATSTAGPYGPYSTPTPLAKFPQMDPSNAISYHPDLLCYGVAEQPDFETSDAQILLTYNTSSNVSMVLPPNTQQSFVNIFNNPTGQFYTVFSQYGTPPPAPTGAARPLER